MTDDEIVVLTLVITTTLARSGCDGLKAMTILGLALKYGEAVAPVSMVVQAHSEAERIFTNQRKTAAG